MDDKAIMVLWEPRRASPSYQGVDKILSLIVDLTERLTIIIVD